jgi:hypothetical protein
VTDPVIWDTGATYTPGVSERRNRATTFLHCGLKDATAQSGTAGSISAKRVLRCVWDEDKFHGNVERAVWVLGRCWLLRRRDGSSTARSPLLRPFDGSVLDARSD